MEKTIEFDTAVLLKLTGRIATAYVGNHVVPTGDLPRLITDIHGALIATSSQSHIAEPPEKPVPKVPIRRSVQEDYLICLEDGQKFKSLKRHLMTHYNLTPKQYREKWDLPADYPMVAPAYAEARSKLAKQIGLGLNRKRGRIVN